MKLLKYTKHDPEPIVYCTITDKIPEYANSVEDWESINEIRYAVKVVKRFKRIDPKPKSEIIKSLFQIYIRENSTKEKLNKNVGTDMHKSLLNQ